MAHRSWSLVFTCTLALVGCGGDDGDTDLSSSTTAGSSSSVTNDDPDGGDCYYQPTVPVCPDGSYGGTILDASESGDPATCDPPDGEGIDPEQLTHDACLSLCDMFADVVAGDTGPVVGAAVDCEVAGLAENGAINLECTYSIGCA
ncbi:MAG: hypothetical protein R3A51_15980 [Nannocystaceae bacterium]|nr:hypothetical protein [Myxococcales bacterium]